MELLRQQATGGVFWLIGSLSRDDWMGQKARKSG